LENVFIIKKKWSGFGNDHLSRVREPDISFRDVPVQDIWPRDILLRDNSEK